MGTGLVTEGGILKSGGGSVTYSVGFTGLVVAGATRYLAPVIGIAGLLVTESHKVRLPNLPGKLRRLRVRGTGPGAGLTDTITTRLNGASSALTRTLTGAGVQDAINTGSVDTAAEDLLSFAYASDALSVAADVVIDLEWVPRT